MAKAEDIRIPVGATRVKLAVGIFAEARHAHLTAANDCARLDPTETALLHLVEKPARYLGMIGSKRKIRLIFDDLRRMGLAEEALARVHAPIGFDIVSLKDPSKARVLMRWRIDRPEVHAGIGGTNGKYFKLKGRYYDVQSFQMGSNGPDADLGAVILDVTGLPDTTKVRSTTLLPIGENIRSALKGWNVCT